LNQILRRAALPILLILLVLSRILFVWVNITLLLLAALSTLAGLPTLAALLTLLILPLALLTALLFILVHIVCHGLLLHFCNGRFSAPVRDNCWHLCN
jgi:hypothetical protein